MKMSLIAATASASLFLTLPSLGALTISSTFDTDLDGWAVNNATPIFQPTGGNPGGYLFFDNPETTISMLLAPAKFLGDLRAFDGGTFSFDGNLIQQLGPNFAEYGTVTLSPDPEGASRWTLFPISQRLVCGKRTVWNSRHRAGAGRRSSGMQSSPT